MQRHEALGAVQMACPLSSTLAPLAALSGPPEPPEQSPQPPGGIWGTRHGWPWLLSEGPCASVLPWLASS